MADGPNKKIALVVSVVLFAVAAATLAQVVSADFSGDRWRYFKPIALPPSLSEDSLVEMLPDLEVFAHSAATLQDLRIVKVEAQREVPYKLLVERGEQRRAALRVTIRDLGDIAGQYTNFVADLGREGILHNELEVRTPSKNFQRTVVVEGSPDGETWAVLEDEAQIFDFTIKERNFNARDTRVSYPISTARYLRIRIVNGDELPLEVSGAVAFFTQSLPPREIELTVSLTGREENVEKRQTQLVLDLGTQGFPSNRLLVTTSQENFYRQVSLDGSNDRNIWSLLEPFANIYAFNTPRFVGSKLEISYPEAAFRYFRLTIHNEDNPPLPVSGARAFGALRKLVFAVEPDKTYRLYYGNPLSRAPFYELERIFPYLVTDNLPQAVLEIHSVNPGFAELTGPSKPFTERYPWLLPTVVALAALLIGVFLASLLRQVRRTLSPPPS